MSEPRAAHTVALPALDDLLSGLRAQGYTVVGPTLRSGAVVYDELRSADDLPIGVTDLQSPGRYRVEPRQDQARFGYAASPHSAKRELLPPAVRLWLGRRGEGAGGITFEQPADPPRVALLGVRPCDLHAIAIQDRVLLGGAFGDADYAARRDRLFVIAVNCGEAGGTCFCVSMGTGPRADSGYDLALTELLDGGEHRFLVEVGSERGADLLEPVAHAPATPGDLAAAARASARAASQMGRELDTNGLPALLQRNREHPRLADAAERCLSCGNCTLVCPTCFCTAVEDVTDLTGDELERRRLWDSCFNEGFSRMHGGAVRVSGRSRYRQWITHKLSTWHDQFGSSGCVGCGRCITWCPVGIDLTEEVAAIRATDGAVAEEDARGHAHH